MKSYGTNGTSYAPVPEKPVDLVDELERFADARASARKRLHDAKEAEGTAARDHARKREQLDAAQKAYDEAGAALVKAAQAVKA